MLARCPRCGSRDLVSSRTRGLLDGALRVLALPPRRCAACGWRGYRPRALCKVRRASSPELPAVTLPVEQARADAVRFGKPRSRRTAVVSALLALVLGLAAGLVAFCCAELLPWVGG